MRERGEEDREMWVVRHGHRGREMEREGET